MNDKRIELLAPGGDLEKLKMACVYGADAVYVGGKSLGLRAGAKNFTPEELAEGITFAHAAGVFVYVTVNIFAHNGDLDGAGDYFQELREMGADGVLISDPGLFAIAREAAPELDIHISTQTNTTNHRAVRFWRDMGAKRVVLARELSLDEIAAIRAHVPDMELEAFVHGAMCVSYSGRCLLSGYMTGRGANRGECAQPCRWEYSLMESKRPGEYFPVFEDERGSYIMNSRDLCMAGHLPELLSAGISSLKIEGRMKSAYYAAVTTRAYRAAIDDYQNDPALYASRRPLYLAELEKASHRRFSTGFYLGKPTAGDQVYDSASYIRGYDFIGVVRGYDAESGFALVEQRNRFGVGDSVELIGRGLENATTFTVTEMYDMDGKPLSSAPHPQQLLRLKTSVAAREFDILRKVKEEE